MTGPARWDSYSQNAAENYERYFVPSIGRPAAEKLVEAAGPDPGDRVLAGVPALDSKSALELLLHEVCRLHENRINPLPIEPASIQYHSLDVTRGPDVLERIRGEQYQIRQIARPDDAEFLVATECPGSFPGGGTQGFDRTEAGLGEQPDFLVQAPARQSVGHTRVSARQQPDAPVVQNSCELALPPLPQAARRTRCGRARCRP